MEESGPLLITHWGLSGPAILKLSAWKARELADLKYNFEIKVNFIGIDKEQAEEIFRNYREENPKKTIGNVRIFEITNRFWHRILWLSKVDLEKNISHINKQELQKILENLCENTMQVKGKSTFKDEFVTAGGVDLNEIDFEEAIDLLKNIKEENSKKLVSKYAHFELPKRLWENLVKAAGITEETKWADVNKKQLNTLAEQLTNGEFQVNGKSTFKEEFVTAGGIDLKEVNFKTMESKILPNMFFAGEILNIDAITGGFNFQNAWTGGFIVANAITSIEP
jgi:predicted flavoprotein YhiN